MNLTLAYRGRSAIVTMSPGAVAVSLAPNLRRDRVSFDGALRHPLRFREAIGALHDVVVSDLRRPAKDHSAYHAYLDAEKAREIALSKAAASQSRASILKESALLADVDVKDLEKRYRSMRSLYWGARQKYSNFLGRHDPELWRLLVPCDPVITVAPDCLFFECFSADESSYGCLTVDLDGFTAARNVALGTTNVDYSWSLYEHFQKLRSYRETRFLVDPSGFEVRAASAEAYREEKIDLPPSWLKGFMQVQAAMSLPMRRVAISREGIYNVLAFLNRHRAAKSPRAVRFELRPGQPIAIVLEPWEKRIVLHSNRYDGPRAEDIRVWGRDRLRLLARLLPMLDEAEVYLLGSGLPSFWSIRMGEMRLLLGLSGWTANDWTGSTALDQLAPPGRAQHRLARRHRRRFPRHPDAHLRANPRSHRRERSLSRGRIESACADGSSDPRFARGRLSMAADHAIAVVDGGARPGKSREGRRAGVDRAQGAFISTAINAVTMACAILEGQVPDRPVSLLLDADGRMLRGKCSCSHHFSGGLRKGPCRHLQALRDAAHPHALPRSLESWYALLED